MIKTISKGEIKSIRYGSITHDKASIIPCANTTAEIDNGTIVNLATLNNYSLEVTKEAIGKIIDVDNDYIKIHFNTTFGFNNNLYALLKPSIRNPVTVIIAYQELTNHY